MPTTLPTDVLIPLSDGHVIRESVFAWLIDASFRLSFSLSQDGKLSVRPRAAVTLEDDAFIRAHRDELLAAVRYVEDQVLRPS